MYASVWLHNSSDKRFITKKIERGKADAKPLFLWEEEMPDYIDILGLRYPINYVDCVNKTDPRKGEIDFLTHEIRIDRNMPRDLQEQTLLHEVIHAIGDALEIDELVQNENTVQSLASALYCTFKDRVILSDEIRIPFMIGDKKVKEIVTRTHYRSL